MSKTALFLWCFSLFAHEACFTIFSFNDSFSMREGQSLPKVMSLLELEKKDAEEVVTLVNSPLVLSEKHDGKIAGIFDEMGIDFVCLNASSLENMDTIVEKAKFKCLGANIIDIDDKPLSNQVHFFQKNGIKVGFFGLLDEKKHVKSNKYNLLPFLYTASDKIEELKKKGVDLIVIVSSLGVESNRLLVKKFPEIDVIISSHSLDPVGWFEGKTFILQSSDKENLVTRIDLVVEKKETPWRTKTEVYPSWRTISNEAAKPHPEISKMIN
ncbi:MAG: hypothetical protein PVI40_03685 [Chlamydiota bacterium]